MEVSWSPEREMKLLLTGSFNVSFRVIQKGLQILILPLASYRSQVYCFNCCEPLFCHIYHGGNNTCFIKFQRIRDSHIFEEFTIVSSTESD